MYQTDSKLRINRMINNAGTGGIETAGKIHEMTEETWDFTMFVPSILIPAFVYSSSR